MECDACNVIAHFLFIIHLNEFAISTVVHGWLFA